MRAVAGRLALALLLALVLVGEARGQCALCRESLRKSGDMGLINGIYISILMLVTAPTLLMVGIGLALRRAYNEKLRLERQTPATVTNQEPNACVRT